MDVDISVLSAVLLLFGVITLTVGFVLYKVRARQMKALVTLVPACLRIQL